MASDLPGTDTLKKLQSTKQVALIDAVDKLRHRGIDRHFSLPQLIVCGDQSSGKSSVLEGLTSLNFPTKDGLCTTFATEVVLRKEETMRITCRIRPGLQRSPPQIQALVNFERTYSSPDEFSFEKLVDEAKQEMAVGNARSNSPFFDDVLQICYSGPDVPSLTIVDLPGLIQSQILGEQKTESVQKVHDLVDRYMCNERSIILAVVSARNDLENQAVFKKVGTVDPKGKRTLGIITKPDLLDVGSESETRFKDLANDRIMPLELGWHVLRNRSFATRGDSHAERNRVEREFFSSGSWSSLPSTNVGIDNLRSKVSEVLLRHICKELPIIREDVTKAIFTTESEIAALGKPREDSEKQRLYLTRNAERFQKLTNDASHGIYDEPSFNEGGTVPRLRTEIHNLNIAFRDVMFRKGHSWNIDDDEHLFDVQTKHIVSEMRQQYDNEFEDPSQTSRSTFLDDYIGNYVERSRTSGLSFIVNPRVIVEVFRDQSERWESIARYHLARVLDVVEGYLHAVLATLMDQTTYSKLLLEQIHPELDKRRTALNAKLEELLVPFKSQDLMSLDPSLEYEVELIRAKRYDGKANGLERQARQMANKAELLTEGSSFTHSDILDIMQTYYKVRIVSSWTVGGRYRD